MAAYDRPSRKCGKRQGIVGSSGDATRNGLGPCKVRDASRVCGETCSTPPSIRGPHEPENLAMATGVG